LALGEAVPGGIAWFDDEFRLVGANRYASEHLPWGKDAYVGRNLPSSEPAREVELFLASLFARAAESAAEASGSLADGPDATHVLSARTFGGGTRAVVVALDAADRQQAEAELKSARRLETAGRLAAQVAHDYNNLLWPLASYPELMKLRLPPDDPLVPMCDAMLDVARRMAGISEDLVVLGRRARSELVPLDLNQLVQETVSGLPPAPDSLHLEVRLEAKAPLVRGSAGQLTRVLTNLLMNARDAVEDAGDVVLMTENVSLAEPIGHYERVPAGEYVRVTVADNGTGIRDDIKSRLFDPFFTTKVGGKRSGTGLGLCVVHAITEDHNGHVDLESSVGIGTTFYVYIPTDPGHAMPPEASPLLRGQERILIVDDDPVQRTLLTALLGALGYRVTAAEDGDEAMDHLQADDADLVILDMRLGDGPDGAEVLRRVKALRPQQRAILLSGFADADRVQEALKLGAGGFVRKPVSMDRLAQVVRAELDRTI
jgi:signal transduction histidine kinase